MDFRIKTEITAENNTIKTIIELLMVVMEVVLVLMETNGLFGHLPVMCWVLWMGWEPVQHN